MRKDKKILEIGAEGGSITIYRYDESEHHDWYYHRVSEMSYEDLDMPGVNKKSRYSMSIGEALIRMQGEYKDVYSLYPLYVDPAYKDIVILMLKSYQEKFDRNINFEQWAKVLGVEEDDIRVNFKYSESDFEYLTKKYGKYASWAIWNSEDEKDTKVIFTNKSLLNTKYVGVGLNISNPVKTWGNFRGGKHDRKLKQAFNESTIRGFYLTDIIKGVKDANSINVLRKIKNNEINIREQVNFFIEEMCDVQITSKTTFIIFGNAAYYLFNKYLKEQFPYNKIIKHKHYSCRGTDKDWVDSITKTLQLKPIDIYKL